MILENATIPYADQWVVIEDAIDLYKPYDTPKCQWESADFVASSASLHSMPLLSSIIPLLLCAVSAFAAPTPENIALARKYAPQWRFHPSELYWPSTVEYFLAGVKQTDSKGNVVNAAVTTSNIDDPPNQGSGLYLTTDINAGKAGFLRGQNPSTTATSVYTFIAPKDNGVVDLFYWLFTPFNEAKSVPVLGQVGDHVGDWERMTVRTVNGVATQVDYHAHSDTGSGTMPFANAIKFDNGQRPVGYIAKGSHGFWATAGTFTYVDAVIFKLQDEAADGGVAWDTKDSLVAISYPDSFSGGLDWLNYKGAWGNIGVTDCWWHIFYDECAVVTGPNGPLRDDVLGAARVALADTIPSKFSTHGSLSQTASVVPAKYKMHGPLSQTLGTVSTEGSSSYTFFVDKSSFASDSSFTQLAVEQFCASLAELADNDSNPNITASLAATQLTTETKYTIKPQACPQNSTVTSYAVGVCTRVNTNCLWAPPRPLRAFSADPSLPDVQQTTAIVVDDLDSWRW